MKQGLSGIVELAKLIEAQQEVKRDFIVHPDSMTMTVPGVFTDEGATPDPELLIGRETFKINETAHQQIASYLKIPAVYYDRMRRETPALLRDNVNEWLVRSNSKRMVRVLDNNVRAFLSPKYRRFDNYDLLDNLLPVIGELQLKLVSCQVTEGRMYIKAISERLTGEVRKGDVVQSGLTISNSEIGWGTVNIDQLIYRLVCTNGAVMNAGKKLVSRRHVGANLGTGIEDYSELFTNETLNLDDRAFWSKVVDVLRGSLNEVRFNTMIETMRNATEHAIVSAPEKVVELTQKRFGLSETEKDLVQKHLYIDNDMTQYGLGNAVTRASQEVDSYDRATELERLGGSIIELSPREWEVIATAA